MNKKHYRSVIFVRTIHSVGKFIKVWFIRGLDVEALRWSYLVRGEKPADDPVVFVDLMLMPPQIGDKPWDRLNHAQTLHALLNGASQDREDIVLSILEQARF